MIAQPGCACALFWLKELLSFAKPQTCCVNNFRSNLIGQKESKAAMIQVVDIIFVAFHLMP